ncbi:Importin subunit alpha-7 [Dissostichus eleginoides]|uniref:Importin subunit alpha-7 n=1 Tax=Dissostichus eleginoides TaxID=100907 RepID=A0AAD9F664_DISEL|nr:Importin subunit alpha-7 [Dissostichus eleginoides]
MKILYIGSASQASLRLSLPSSFPDPCKPCLVPGASLWDVVWGFSELQADEILRSSSFFQELRAGNLTQRCYTHFLQQEALYLTGVSSTLEALIGRLQESLPGSPTPQWLRLSFPPLVVDDPVYFLLALSARVQLRVLMAGEMMGVGVKESRVLQQWKEDTQEEVTWILRLRKLMEERQGHMDAFKAINIFREQMMNQKSFYKALACDEEEKKR